LLGEGKESGCGTKKKRGSLSRAKSTPKEEGGGDKGRSRVVPNSNLIKLEGIMALPRVEVNYFLCVAPYFLGASIRQLTTKLNQ
jgi:hypothetical protein